MSDQVLVALITAIAGIVTLLVQQHVRAKKLDGKIDEIGSDAREAKEQVKNTHKTNFRDDLDRFRDEVRGTLSEIRAENAVDKAEMHQALRIIRGDISDIRASDNTDRDEHNSMWSAIKKVATGTREA